MFSGRGGEADMSRPDARLHDQPGDDASNGEKTHKRMLSSMLWDYCILWCGLYLFRQGFVDLEIRFKDEA